MKYIFTGELVVLTGLLVFSACAADKNGQQQSPNDFWATHPRRDLRQTKNGDDWAAQAGLAIDFPRSETHAFNITTIVEPSCNYTAGVIVVTDRQVVFTAFQPIPPETTKTAECIEALRKQGRLWAGRQSPSSKDNEVYLLNDEAIAPRDAEKIRDRVGKLIPNVKWHGMLGGPATP